jgi:Raf kinase inhibitor-like YbhB/YbcL family protein
MKVRLRTECIWRMLTVLTALSLAATAFAGCESEQPPEEVKMALNVSGSAFAEGSSIPIKYSCQGEDVSPTLQWDEPPTGTQSFALIMDDPDAPGGVFTHWVLFNIPANVRQLGEGVPAQEQLQNGALQGKNDFGRIGYGGPCPPHGTAHRYRFTLYALDRALDTKPGASKKQVLDAMKEHILAQGQLMGTYQR